MAMNKTPVTGNRTPIADYVDTNEMAALLGVHPTTLVKWRTARKGPPFHRLGQKVLYSVSRFEAWLEQQEVQPLR
jgi:excisionase family DNA binding protein